MTDARKRIAFLGGLTAAVLYEAWRVYGSRSRERVVSHEGIDDPAVVQAFNRVAALPQMRLLRAFVARRAVAMKRSGWAADLGCGPGHLVIRLAQAAPGLHVTGIDLSDAMLIEAEKHARRSGVEDRIAFKKGDAARIPFPDGSLDLAFLVFDLRRDMAAPFYLLLWFGTHWVMPEVLRRVNEPLASRDAAFTLQEAAHLADQPRLPGWRVTHGPVWLTIEGVKP
jgi:SAM-dependent methyltransferase